MSNLPEGLGTTHGKHQSFTVAEIREVLSSLADTDVLLICPASWFVIQNEEWTGLINLGSWCQEETPFLEMFGEEAEVEDV